MTRTKSGSRSSRRRFLAVAGAAVAAVALGPTPGVFAQAAAAKPKAPAPPDTARPATPETPPEVVEEAKALLQIIQRRYGRHLDAKQLEAVTRELEFRVASGKRLRDVKFGNHEEPDFTFRA